MTRRYLSAAAAFALAFTVSTSAFAGVIRADREPQAYLDLAASPLYQSVGQFQWSDTKYNYFGSGTLIASPGNLWVLSAAHVLDTPESRTFSIGGSAYNVVQSVVYPGWTGNLNDGYDIALAKLNAAPAVTPAARYTGSTEVGKLGTIVGYGMTGTGLTGATTFDSLKRAGTNMIDTYFRSGSALRMFGVDFDNPAGTSNVFGSAAATNLEYLSSFGDSGGGMFISEGGSTYLAGVTSWGVDYNHNNKDDDYGDYGGYTRVSQFNTWINGVINGTSGGGGGGPGGGKGGGKPRDFAAAVPEPASLALLMVGLLALAGRRRSA